MTVQFARGPRRKDDFGGPQERNVPRPRRTVFRMDLKGLAPETSWQVRKHIKCNVSRETRGSQLDRISRISLGILVSWMWSIRKLVVTVMAMAIMGK